MRLRYNRNYQLKFWQPILENLNVSENNYELFIRYIEMFENNLNIDNNCYDILYLNLKVLSQLDFNKIDFNKIDFKLSDLKDVETIEIKESIDKKIVNDTTALKIIKDIENLLIERLITFLNTKKEISVYNIVNNIFIRDVDENRTEMVLTSRIK